jgi:hypothetical protein
MKEFKFNLHLYIEAKSKAQAKELLQSALDNLSEMGHHAPFGCELVLADDTCEEYYTED